ncbi:unnamed protein product [Gadus morhua 'NCC']
MPTDLISDVGYESVKRHQVPRAPGADIRLNNQRSILGDRTNVGASSSYETVTVQPDGCIQHVLGDPQDAPLPELTDEDLEGLTDVPLWPSALLEQLDFTSRLIG